MFFPRARVSTPGSPGAAIFTQDLQVAMETATADSPPCSRHVPWTRHLPLSPTSIPQLDGGAEPEPEAEPDFGAERYLKNYKAFMNDVPERLSYLKTHRNQYDDLDFSLDFS